MPLTREQIIHKELEYFKSPLAIDPAYLSAEYDEEYGDEGYQEDKCVYKTSDGRKCAVGALIKPAHYQESFDTGDGTPVKGLSDEVINYLGHDNIPWLGDLQKCHDDCARNWSFVSIEEGRNHFGKYFLHMAKEAKLLS